MTIEPPALLNEQILAISKLTGQMRTSLQTVRSSLPPNTLEGLSNLESMLFRVSKQVNLIEEERINCWP